MMIKVLGMGCPNCKKLEQNTKKALKELKIEAEVQKVEDIQKIMSFGVMSTPALIIDDSIVSSGQILDIDKIKELVKNNGKANTNKKEDYDSSGCNGCC